MPAPLNALPLLRTTPYVTVPEFRAMPLYLDTDDLVTTGDTTSGAQDNELTNELIRASAWADNYCNQPLGGHLWSQQKMLTVNRRGEFRFHAEHQPVRQLTAFTYGQDGATQYTLTDLTRVTYPGGGQIVVPLSGGGYSFSGPMQFGAVGLPGERQPCTFTYAAGYATTTVAVAAAANATTITVADATSICPGDVLRIWDPAKEEAVTVQAVAGNVLTLTAGLKNAHAIGAGISSMPPDIKRAVALIAVAYLTRPGTGEDPFADAPVSRTGRKQDPRKRGDGLLDRVKKMLDSYKQVIS